jgi:hypothetical protein
MDAAKSYIRQVLETLPLCCFRFTINGELIYRGNYDCYDDSYALVNEAMIFIMNPGMTSMNFVFQADDDEDALDLTITQKDSVWVACAGSTYLDIDHDGYGPTSNIITKEWNTRFVKFAGYQVDLAILCEAIDTIHPNCDV